MIYRTWNRFSSYISLILSSFVAIIMSVAISKIYALKTGIVGVGYYGYLQSLMLILSLLIGMGIQNSIIRFGAPVIAQNDKYSLVLIRKHLEKIPLLTLPIIFFTLLFLQYFNFIQIGSYSEVVLVCISGCALAYYNYFVGLANVGKNISNISVLITISTLCGGLINILIMFTFRYQEFLMPIALALQYLTSVSRAQGIKTELYCSTMF